MTRVITRVESDGTPKLVQRLALNDQCSPSLMSAYVTQVRDTVPGYYSARLITSMVNMYEPVRAYYFDGTDRAFFASHLGDTDNSDEAMDDWAQLCADAFAGDPHKNTHIWLQLEMDAEKEWRFQN